MTTSTAPAPVAYRLELANRTVKGITVGNLYGVARMINGRRNTYVITPERDETYARLQLARLNALGEPDQAEWLAKMITTYPA